MRRHLAWGLSSSSAASSSLYRCSRHLASFTCVNGVGAFPIREFIEHALYAPRSGYFSRNADLPILSHDSHKRVRHFSALKDRAAYESLLADTFARKSHGWMTPVELYSPYLGRAVANRVAASVSSADRDDLPNLIVEFGGGRGTLAKDILTHLSAVHPAVFQRTQYHLVDISKSLSEQQAASTREFSPDAATVHCKHALDWLASDAAKYTDPYGSEHVHVLAFELLDNLPHDLFRKSRVEERYEQAYVDTDTRELIWSECIDPIAGAAIAQYIRHATPQGGGSGFNFSLRNLMDNLMSKDGATYVWVPTVAHQILSAITNNIASASLSLTVADFTAFPGALPHANGPVVQRVENGVATVYDSVLEAPHGEVDIMFPTDFAMLENEYGGRAVSQAQFFREFAEQGDIENSTCQSGYNPILEDFKNTKFLLVDP